MTLLTYQVGAVRVHLLSDGVFWSDGGAAFGVVPRVLWEKIVRPDALNRIAMELRSLLIESDDGLILVDTGHGAKLSAKRREQLGLTGQRRLLDELANLGYRADDVRMVINTHLHADHCGGNTILDAEGRLAPAFPNATYVVQRLELADATYPNERTRNAYFHENYLPLTNLCDQNGAGVLRILSGDARITSQVRVQVTPGHTRAHQVVIVESRGQSAVFLGDVAGYALNLERLAWVPAFDVEPLVSMETKRGLRDWAFHKDVLLFFQHDISTAAGRLRREEANGQSDGARWRVEPIAAMDEAQPNEESIR
jgi:glyoxylase-like metal-dependent hydrolase (beta-lactamase superfamily II)